MTGKREVYRVRQERPFLRATLCPADGPARHGHVLDISSRGAGLQLDPGAEPMEAGTEAELVLQALVLLKPICTDIRIRQWLVHGDRARCGVQFLDPQHLEKQIPYVLRRDFNRRSEPRIAVEEFTAVKVSPAGDDTRIDARLLDISTGGLRLQAGRTDAEQMARWQQLRLAFSLPGRHRTFCTPAIVRSRQADEVSLAFPTDLETMRPELYDALSDFVLERLPAAGGRTRS